MTPTPDIARLRELLEKATKGPWRFEARQHDFKVLHDFKGADGYNNRIANCIYWSPAPMPQVTREQAEANATLIVEAINALPALLSEREADKARIAELEGALRPANRQQAEYMNLFCWTEPDFDECGGRTMRCVSMPWPKIKAALSAILARTTLGEQP